MNRAFLYILLVLTSKKSAAAGTLTSSIMVIASATAAVNGRITDRQFYIIMAAALAVTTGMLAFFLVFYITGTRANIQQLFNIANTNQNGIIEIRTRTEEKFTAVSGQLKNVHARLDDMVRIQGEQGEGLKANKELKEQILGKMNENDKVVKALAKKLDVA